MSARRLESSRNVRLTALVRDGASRRSVTSAITPSSPTPPESARPSALFRGEVWTAPAASTHVKLSTMSA